MVGAIAAQDLTAPERGAGTLNRDETTQVVKRALPNETACDELIQLIKDNGRWVEMEVPEEVGQPA